MNNMSISRVRILATLHHDKTWTWLRKGNIKRQTKSILIAAQNNAYYVQIFEKILIKKRHPTIKKKKKRKRCLEREILKCI